MGPRIAPIWLLTLLACSPDPDDTAPAAWVPDLYCPGDPSGVCDPVDGAVLEAGAARRSIVPACYEVWTPEGDDYEFDAGTDTFLDCGCDRLCVGDPGYPGPDEGEGDGEFSAVWMAGFGNARAATGVRGPEVGLRGADDGLWARAVVLRQGETTLAIVALDLIGLFHDRVDELAAALAAAGLQVDHLLIHSTHGHEGPDTMGMWGSSITHSGADPAYLLQVQEEVVAAVAEAAAALEPVTLEVGQVDVSAYSPEKGVANVIRDSRDPWVIDERLGAARLAGLDGSTVATIVTWANHPETLADENTLLTSDFVHALRETVEDGARWEARERAGLGGTCVYLNGAVGGMMTTLGVSATDPDGIERSAASFEKADAIGQMVGEMALDALTDRTPEADPRLAFRVLGLTLPVENHGFQAMMSIGIFDREVGCYDPEEDIDEDNLPCIASEVGIVSLGPLRLLAVPGELLPELAIGGYDGSHVNAPGQALVEEDNPNPPDLAAAPAGPYLLDLLGYDDAWVVGLANDEVGYIIPPYDFVLDEEVPWLTEAEGDHYEETNSLGPATADLVLAGVEALAAFGTP